MTDDEKKAAEENFNHRLADVNRCWVKYALNLMSDSRDRLVRDSTDTGTFHTILLEIVSPPPLISNLLNFQMLLI